MPHTPRRVVVALAAAAGLLTGLVAYVTPAPPAAALPTAIYVSGDYWDDPSVATDDGDEILKYEPGTPQDEVYHRFTKTDTAAGSQSVVVGPINGTYDPIVGDFDGDGFDEIVWYAPGTTTDYLWDFDNTVPGLYTPSALTINISGWITTVGDFTGDGADDIFWYRPGTGTETVWEFNPGSLTYTDVPHPINVSGTYTPLGGHFTGDGADDIMWYDAANGEFSLWDFEVGSLYPSSTAYYATGHAGSSPLTLDRRRDGGTDILIYRPGTQADHYWDFDPSGVRTATYEQISGSYRTSSGDYFNDGDDVWWAGDTTTNLWDWYTDTNGVLRRIDWCNVTTNCGESTDLADTGGEVDPGTITFVPVSTDTTI